MPLPLFGAIHIIDLTLNLPYFALSNIDKVILAQILITIYR